MIPEHRLPSTYGGLPESLLQAIFAVLPLKDKVACEAVCRGWRAALRCLSGPSWIPARTSSGVWGYLELYIKSSDHPGPELALNPAWGIKKTVLRMKELEIVDDTPGHSFAAWLRQRAAGFHAIFY